MTNKLAYLVAPNSTNTLCLPIEQIEYLLKYQLLDLVSMSEDEYSALTGGSAVDLLPEVAVAVARGEPDLAESGPSEIGGVGIGLLAVPEPNWYYRTLAKGDPTIAELLAGADLKPVKELVDPVGNAAELSFRHLRPGGNVPRDGTNRISSAANLEAFTTVLSDRGTGELVRIDVDAARRLGSEFLEHDTIMQHLAEYERDMRSELAKARAQGRGKSYLSRIEGRLRALLAAREYALAFREGQGVHRVPSGAISAVGGPPLASAVARERLFRAGLKFVRHGGRVLLVIGIAESVENIASASPDRKMYVATQEAGGWAFSLAAAELGAEAGAAFGGVLGFETGPGGIISAAIGGLIGGIWGFVAGKQEATRLYDHIERTGKLLRDSPSLIETIVLMFGSDDARRQYYEWRELETGESSPWGGF